MKKFLSAHFEKLIFVVALLFLGFLSLVSFLSNDGDEEKLSSSASGLMLSQESGTIIMETKIPHGLMPGDIVTIYGATPEFFNGNFTVETILLPESNSEARLLLSDGNTISGWFKQSGAPELDRKWHSQAGSLSIRTDEGVREIRITELEQLWGSTTFTMAAKSSGDEEAEGDFSLIAYQGRGGPGRQIESTSGGKWVDASSTKKGDPTYDLFTPPVLYVVNGRLETSLPEDAKTVKSPEAFGLRLAAFEKVPYRFRIRSWIGKTPYLEDLRREFPPGSGRFVRNRLELRVPYKENPNYKPGFPSLIPTNVEDTNKMIMVNYFAVQQVRDPRTGGVRSVGRAMVKDFRLLVKPFEINSFMEETHAGQYRISVESTLKKFAGEKFTFEENATGTQFHLGQRDYKILEMDLIKSRVHLEKQALDPPELQREWVPLSAD